MARSMIDIALDALEDLDISNGDFIPEESTPQHQRQLLLNNKGDFKQNADTGVGIDSAVDDENKGEIIREIVKQFMGDGMEVENLSPNTGSVADNKLKVFANAFYK